MENKATRLYLGYRLSFWRLCGVSLLFFASFNMIIAELPDYLRGMGGENYVGFIVFLFTITALISRPYSGKWADSIGRVPVMLIGAIVSALCGLLYLFTTTVFSFLALRLLHGFSTGFTPTGSSAYVADMVPGNKRGEAMGLLGLAGSLGMAVGPALGSYIVVFVGYQGLFICSSAFGIITIAWLAGLRETLPSTKPFNSSMLRVRFSEFYEPRVLAPALVLMLAVLSFGTMVTLIPDRCEVLGLGNKGLFFTVFTTASIFVRFGAGRISDRIGREKVLAVSSLLIGTSMILLGIAESIPALLLGAVLFGLGNGINSPTVLAWAIDLSHQNHIGRGMATVYMGMELGIGLGALVSGSLYAANSNMYPVVFIGSAICCFIAFGFLIYRIARR